MRSEKIKDYVSFSDDKIIFLSLFIYSISPFFSILIMALLIVSVQLKSDKIFLFFIVLLSLYLGLINSTKVPESDLVGYYDIYLLAKNYSLYDYLLLMNKEPFYFFLNYVLFYLFLGNKMLFMIGITMLSYCFYFFAIYKYMKCIGSDNHLIVFALMLAAFFPQLFSLSAHLIRQFLAASILMYAIVIRLFYEKRSWPYSAFAVLTHSTALLFLPLMYVLRLKRKNDFHVFFIFLCAVFVYFLFSSNIGLIVIDIFGKNIFTYPFMRMGHGFYLGSKGLSNVAYFLMIVLLIISLFISYRGIRSESDKVNAGLYQLSNIVFFISFFIIFNLGHTVLSSRFLFYLYFIAPLMLPFVFAGKQWGVVVLRTTIISILVIFFIYRLEYGVWEYGDISLLLFSPITYFII